MQKHHSPMVSKWGAGSYWIDSAAYSQGLFVPDREAHLAAL